MGDPLGRWTASFYPTASDKRTSHETSIVSVVIDFVNELLGKLLTLKSDPRYTGGDGEGATQCRSETLSAVFDGPTTKAAQSGLFGLLSNESENQGDS